jgi:hypothetical protein
MKKSYLMLVAWVLLMLPSFAQNVGINTDASRPNPNAILDIKSGNKGLLIPRMNSAARNAIPNTQGLMVYDTTTNSFWYNTGTKWQTMAAPAALGSLAIADSAWLLSGNGNTNDAVNFLGTTNNVPLNIRVNNQPSGRIDPIRGNTSWGIHSDYSDTSGFDNTAIGAVALQANTTGSYNVATGNHTMYYNTTGSQNTAVGVAALSFNTTGKFNTAMGYQSLFANTTGINNTATGYQSLQANTTGTFNVANGYQALFSNTASGLTAAGYQALYSNTTGASNVATGYQALYSNTIGTFNVATGYQALYSNTTGGGNTATGSSALFLNTTGGSNTAYGSGSLANTIIGSSNVACGDNSLLHNYSGSQNTAIGHYALFQNYDGGGNIAIGHFAMGGNNNGNNNIVIGTAADVTAPNINNAIALGFGALVDNSNSIRIGNFGITLIEAAVPLTVFSDGRYKFNIQENVRGLDFILKLRPITYQFDARRLEAQFSHKSNIGSPAANYAMLTAYDEASRIRRSGFIAQEVEQAANASGYDFSGIIKPKTEQGHYSLSYDAFVVPLVKAVQEQQLIIISQNKKIADLQQQIDEIKKLLNPVH